MKDKEILEDLTQIDLYISHCCKAVLEFGVPNVVRAKKLLELGYQKIDKDSAVLTKEELEIIKSERFNDGQITAKGYFEHYVLNQELAKARKETAEKFAERLKENVHWFLNNEIQKDHFYECLDEICKEITEDNEAEAKLKEKA